MALTKEQIFKAEDCKRERVDVPEWANGDPSQAYIYVRTMKYAEREQFERRWYEGTRNGEIAPPLYQADLISLTAVDDAGNRLFSADDIPALAERNAAVIGRLYAAADRLNALNQEAVSQKKESS